MCKVLEGACFAVWNSVVLSSCEAYGLWSEGRFIALDHTVNSFMLIFL